MFTWKKACATAFAGAVGVGMTFAGAGIAAAADPSPNVINFPDVPGGPATENVITDSDGATVTVTDNDYENGTATVKIANNSGDDLTCNNVYSAAAFNDVAGVVTESDIIADTIARYNQSVILPNFDLTDIGGDSGSLSALGSLGGSDDPVEDAILAGHFGTVDTFDSGNTIADGDSAEATVDLGATNSERSDFDAAAAFLCTDGNDKTYLFTGDEDGNAPGHGPEGGTGSLASLTGSLGSSTGSLGSS